jgi:hypothetical protein
MEQTMAFMIFISSYTTTFLVVLAVLLLCISVYYSWKNFQLLFAPPSVDVWFFPEEIPRTPEIIKDKISLTIKLPAEATIARKTVYPIIVHGNLSFGFLFFYFLRVQYNYGLMVIDNSPKEKHGWKFYAVSRSGKRKFLLDPELTLRENGLKENSVIEAVRATA